jgi:hypothetical protein
MNYFAAWSLLGIVAALFIGFETRGRTIEDIDNLLTSKGHVATPVKIPAA